MVTKRLANKIEKIIAKKLNKRRVPMSGAGIEKEDITDDNFLGQIKATSKKSISIKRDDVNALIKHSLISHKIPLWVFHFECPEEVLRYRTWVALPVEFINEFKNLID